MSIIAIDILTKEFYDTISFRDGVSPDSTTLYDIFHGDGLLINNSSETALLYTALSYVQNLESLVAVGETKQYISLEIASKTEIFGKAAQRASIYEYTFADYEPEVMSRGINFIQYVQIGENWYITSMVWHDENEDHQIPAAYLRSRV
ncbi:hypothetical protein [Mucilaginibacter antarcticus]|uniref:SnoaL-like protein n=1 Tax=Mucilaginibacter antarcticus TaxID=1855725 RepID=A0ABW5XU70_9SPHI